MTTLADIRRRAAPHGITVVRDDFAYRAEAPAGHTLDGDLHEYVAPFQHGSGMADARADLFDRLAGVEPEPCTGPCDWCGREI